MVLRTMEYSLSEKGLDNVEEEETSTINGDGDWNMDSVDQENSLPFREEDFGATPAKRKNRL